MLGWYCALCIGLFLVTMLELRSERGPIKQKVIVALFLSFVPVINVIWLFLIIITT